MILNKVKIKNYRNYKDTEINFNDEKDDNGYYKFGAEGLDNVEFLISANPGEPLKPLAKIASGGELSRVMLALGKCLNMDNPILPKEISPSIYSPAIRLTMPVRTAELITSSTVRRMPVQMAMSHPAHLSILLGVLCFIWTFYYLTNIGNI